MVSGKKWLATVWWLLQLAIHERFRTKPGWVKSWLQKVHGTWMRPTTSARLLFKLHKMKQYQKLVRSHSTKLNRLSVRRSSLRQRVSVLKWPAQTGGNTRLRRQLMAAPAWTQWRTEQLANCKQSSQAITPLPQLIIATQRSNQSLRLFRSVSSGVLHQ